MPEDIIGKPEPRYKSIVAVVSALVAVAALIVSSVVGYQSISVQRDLARDALAAQHDQAVRADRAAAYAGYLGSLAQFNEFIWANLTWAGNDAPSKPPSEEMMQAKFWEPAAQLQAELGADLARARMYTFESGPDQELTDLDAAQNRVFLEFKCMANRQDASTCQGVAGDATNAQIQRVLEDWYNEDARLREQFLKKAAAQVR